MEENILKLNNEFERIKNMGWIEEKKQYIGASGYTFEALLKKKADDFPLPDYGNIEIKTISKNKKTSLHLFGLTPDGDYLFPIKRIISKLGIPYKDNEELRYFYVTFNAKEYSNLALERKGKIKVNHEMNKIELQVINNESKDIGIGISWSLNYLKKRLIIKLSYLAIVTVSLCRICGKRYYHYDKINYYKLKEFDIFIKLIEQGIIDISFKIGVYKSGPKKGMYYDHGTSFSINIKDINKLYDEITI